MRARIFCCAVTGTMLLAAAGCRTGDTTGGPRWSWWPGAGKADAARLAETAPAGTPQLPSAAARAESLADNVAAQADATSSRARTATADAVAKAEAAADKVDPLADLPSARYPDTTAAYGGNGRRASLADGSSAAGSAAARTASAEAALSPQNKPYDPSGYVPRAGSGGATGTPPLYAPATSVAAGALQDAGQTATAAATAIGDRYRAATAAAPAGVTPPAYPTAVLPSPAQSGPVGNRYAATPAPSAAKADSPAAGATAATATAPAYPTTGTPAGYRAADAPATGVQPASATSPAPYRPGGTSDYVKPGSAAVAPTSPVLRATYEAPLDQAPGAVIPAGGGQ